MKTPIDDRLRLEAERFEFRFACEDCAHFDAEAVECSLEYPAAPRRDVLIATEVARATDLELCKAFELG